MLLLENPRGGGAWWAAVSGVAQSLTRLKRLSSSTVFLPGESQGRGSLVGCRLRGLEELDTTERLHFRFHFGSRTQSVPNSSVGKESACNAGDPLEKG